MDTLFPGKVIGVRIGFVTHVGIVSDKLLHGEPMVISNSSRAGGVAEEPLSLFKGPFSFVAVPQPPVTPLAQVMGRARGKIGTTWNLFIWNCEHFVRHAFGIKPESPQLKLALITAGVFWFLTRSAK